MIVALFVVCWASALAFWKFGRVEERWSARLQPAPVHPIAERAAIADGAGSD